MQLLAITILLTPIAVAANTNLIAVGGGNLNIFTPLFTDAAAGDTITFTFLSGNHSVTQSTFESPCEANPLQSNHNTGFTPVAPGTSNFPTSSFTVDSTEPMWFFCAQGGESAYNHCSLGMVFAVNPPNKTAFDAFQAKARAAVLGATAAPTTTPEASSINLLTHKISFPSSSPFNSPTSTNGATFSTQGSRKASVALALIFGTLGVVIPLATAIALFYRHRRHQQRLYRTKAIESNSQLSTAMTPALPMMMIPSTAAYPSTIRSSFTPSLSFDGDSRAEWRQRSPRDQTQWELNDLQKMTRDPSSSESGSRFTGASPAMTHVFEQMDSMRAEIDRLRQLQQSVWARGPSNESPPSYDQVH